MNGSIPARFVACTALAVCLAIGSGSQRAAGEGSDAASPNNVGHDLDSVLREGVLRVAMTHFDIPPFHIRRNDGTYVGKDIDFIDKLAGALGTKVRLVDDPPSFDAVIDAIAAGRADIGLSKLSQTYRRLAKVRFSEPYFTLRHAVLFDRAVISHAGPGASPEQALRAYEGKIGVIGASAYVDFAKANYPRAQIVEFPSWDATIKALLQRKVGMVYRDEFEIRSVLINDPAIHVEFGAAVLSDRRSFLTAALCNTCVKLDEFVNYFIAQNPGAYELDGLLTMHLQK